MGSIEAQDWQMLIYRTFVRLLRFPVNICCPETDNRNEKHLWNEYECFVHMKPGWKVIACQTKEASKREPVKTGTLKTWGWRRTGRRWTWRSWRTWGGELLRGGAQGAPAVEWSPAGHTIGRPATNSRTTTSLLTLSTTQTPRMRLSMVMGFLIKNIARIANAVQVTICLLVFISVY